MVNRLEKAFGPIEKSKWQKAAMFRRRNRNWLRKSQRIAVLILEYLDSNKISQKAFAAQLNVSPQMVNKWVRGSENFTLETISKLEAAMHLTLIEIVNNSEGVKVTQIATVEQKYTEATTSKPSYKKTAKIILMETVSNFKTAHGH